MPRLPAIATTAATAETEEQEEKDIVYDTLPPCIYTSTVQTSTTAVSNPTQEPRPHCPQCKPPPHPSHTAQLVAVLALAVLSGVFWTTILLSGLLTTDTHRPNNARASSMTKDTNHKADPTTSRSALGNAFPHISHLHTISPRGFDTSFSDNLMLWALLCGILIAMFVGVCVGFGLRLRERKARRARQRGRERERERERKGKGKAKQSKEGQRGGES
jgi:hypothetical protein